MSKYEGDIIDLLTQKHAQAIYPIPELLPNQRGPSCGFYALGYVLNYWHSRFEEFGGDYRVQPPLPPRGNMDGPKQTPSSNTERQQKNQRAAHGQFKSLRQYGKYHGLTVLGSVFNAMDLVRVAKGQNSQYAGQFDGNVVDVSVENFTALVKRLLDWECPVIVPYDVSVDAVTEGEPAQKAGEAAHWIAIIGYYREGQHDYAIYYNWGEFYTAKLQDFAVSNAQLTSNRHLTFAKYRIVDQDQDVYFSDYARRSTMQKTVSNWQQSEIEDGGERQFKLVRDITKHKHLHNPEFNDPTLNNQAPEGRADQLDGRDRMIIGGLRGKVVVVYRSEDAQTIRGTLQGYHYS
ncbi:hypothetical protein KJY73_06230 [Bowmanella sp. Y26]|uniref:hypothetical protein n=1 Tax=Bowmanella yangjiangensis TaxID=2811230 RepID=UPI001BDBF853|nr:hypothetical protein [Bowmanella yangjiangensis]MBT1063162.1 hypothetical protein [Bowmanella yangjiangensis]